MTTLKSLLKSGAALVAGATIFAGSAHAEGQLTKEMIQEIVRETVRATLAERDRQDAEKAAQLAAQRAIARRAAQSRNPANSDQTANSAQIDNPDQFISAGQVYNTQQVYNLPDPGYTPSGASPNRKTGWFAQVDLLYFKPVMDGEGVEDIFINGPNDNNREYNAEFDYTLTPRVSAGFEGQNGSGVRFRFMHIDDKDRFSAPDVDNDPTAPNNTLNSSIELFHVDGEYTQRGTVGTWEYLASAGVRYAEIDISTREFDGSFGGDLQLENGEFSGWGPTASIEARRKIFDLGGFGVTGVAGARASYLAGTVERFDRDFDGLGTGAVPFVLDSTDREDYNVDMPIFELSAGLEHERETPYGLLTMGVNVEFQRWMHIGGWFEGDDDGDEQMDLSLQGVGFTVRLQN